jgi:hypothetical protein
MKLDWMYIVVVGILAGWCLMTVRLGGLLEMVYVMIIQWCFLEVRVCGDCGRAPKWMVVGNWLGWLLELLLDNLGSIWPMSLDKLKEESKRRKGNKWWSKMSDRWWGSIIGIVVD